MLFINKLFCNGFFPTYAYTDHGYIPESRNVLARQIIDHPDNYDVVLWIDSDQTFTFESFINLLKTFDINNLNLLTGSYLKRHPTDRFICSYLINDTLDAYNPLLEQSNGLLKIDGCGFGFFLMHKKVLLDLFKKYDYNIFEMPFIGKKGEIKYKGEDFIFCEKAKEIGYDIYLDCNCKIGHSGYVHTPNDQDDRPIVNFKRVEQ